MGQVIEQLGWKCLYVRPVAPDTRGVTAMIIEGGRMQARPLQPVAGNQK